MKGKIMLVFVAVTVLLLAFASTTKAAAPILRVYGYTDKTYYEPGETVTLKFWIYNEGDATAIVKNITIVYPWYNTLIGGNKTLIVNTNIPQGGNYSGTDTFEIPRDSRARTTNPIGFVGYYEFGGATFTFSGSTSLNVITGSDYAIMQAMDNLITLFTVQVVLLIVCTIIVAATIFLSARRPQVTWKAEEKEE